MSTVSQLDRILEPVTKMMPVDFAQRLVDLRADDSLEQRIRELRSKATQGALSPEEDREYKEIVDAVDLIGLLQAKARRILSQQG